MNAMYAFFAVLVLIGLVLLGLAANLQVIFGTVIPYIAIAVFVVGVVYRIIRWAVSPVPFKIPTTCGQQKSLPWFKTSHLESPPNKFWVLVRMALEILFFRSLFRNTKMDIKEGANGPRAVYGGEKYLWLAGLVFHWSFLFVVVRHLRFFIEPVPTFVLYVQNLDGLMQVGVPVLYMTSFGLLAAVTFLYLRRVVIPQVSYISLAADYFPLFLIMAIAITGILTRHTSARVDITQVKQLTMGLLNFSPSLPEGLGAMFFIHLFLVSILLIYFPMSKLMHMAGVFMSPTRNLANDNRRRRHVNPWDYPVKVHTYEEWEDEFRELMHDAGMPLEKPLEKKE